MLILDSVASLTVWWSPSAPWPTCLQCTGHSAGQASHLHAAGDSSTPGYHESGEPIPSAETASYQTASTAIACTTHFSPFLPQLFFPIHSSLLKHTAGIPQLTEGQMISPYGPSLLENGSLFSCSRQNMITGRVNTRVLPEPVNAMPIMSLPERLQRK